MLGSSWQGEYSFFCIIRRHSLACEDSWWVRHVSGGHVFFCKIQRPFRWVPDVRWRNHYFARNKEAFPCVRPWTQLSGGGIIILRVQSTTDGCRSLTTLTRLRREHHGGGRRRGLGRERHGAGEDSAMVAHAVGSTRVYWSDCHRRKITGGVGE